MDCNEKSCRNACKSAVYVCSFHLITVLRVFERKRLMCSDDENKMGLTSLSQKVSPPCPYSSCHSDHSIMLHPPVGTLTDFFSHGSNLACFLYVCGSHEDGCFADWQMFLMIYLLE